MIMTIFIIKSMTPPLKPELQISPPLPSLTSLTATLHNLSIDQSILQITLIMAWYPHIITIVTLWHQFCDHPEFGFSFFSLLVKL